jgi:hypothetical protein
MQKREEEMLERHVFMAALQGFMEGEFKRFLQLTGDHDSRNRTGAGASGFLRSFPGRTDRDHYR